jgi:hypothetical protein
MSVGAAMMAVDACERMRAALLGFADSHEHAANIARLDWSGPHRDSFEVSFAEIQAELVRQAAAMARLASAIEEAAAAMLVQGPR